MRTILLLLACLVLPAFAHAQSGEYEIAEIDPAANTFTGTLNGQPRAFRVRPAVEVTINGLKATFAELEAGMKAKVTSAEPGMANKIVATGLRTQKPSKPGAGPTPALIGGGGQASRLLKAAIPADSPNAFPIGDVRKGTKISFQYTGGQWKSWGRIATSNPDDAGTEGGEACRVVIALPAVGNKGGNVLAIVPPDTRKHPFVFEAQSDYTGLVLRINDKDNTFSGNPGTVEYNVKILPPPR